MPASARSANEEKASGLSSAPAEDQENSDQGAASGTARGGFLDASLQVAADGLKSSSLQVSVAWYSG